MLNEIKLNLIQAEKANQEPCLVYGRVSTSDQKKGLSLEDQNHRAFTYAAEKNLYIVHVFSGSESAYSQGRKNFNLMLDIALEHKISNIIVKNSDRLARNDHDWARLKDLVKFGGLHIHFFELNMIFTPESTAEEIMFFDSTSTMAKYWSNKNRQATIASNKHKAKKGIYPVAMPPLGYTYDKEKKTHIKDEATKNLVHYIFDLFDSEKLSVEAVRERLNNEGLKTYSKTALYYMLSNPFYAGDFVYNGDEYRGTHEPYITKRQYEERLRRMKIKFRGKKSRDTDYLFKGILRHEDSGRIMTGDLKHGAHKSGDYIYYYCRTPEAVSIREDRLFELIDKEIDKMTITPGFAELLTEIFKDSINEFQKDHSKQQCFISNKITRLEKEQQKLLDYLIKGGDVKSVKIRMDANRKAIDKFDKDRAALRLDKQKFVFEVSDVIETIRKFPEIYRQDERAESVKTLRMMISDITYNGEDIKINWLKPFCYLITPELLQYADLTKNRVRKCSAMRARVNDLRTHVDEIIPLLLAA